MAIQQELPEPVQPVIEAYIEQLNQQFPDLLYSFYIVGSIAMGEYNENFSDIDFVTVLDRTLTSAELPTLQSIHKALQKKYPKQKLSGDYFQRSELGRADQLIESHPHYHDGRLHPNGSKEMSLVTWWELKNHGIPVVGVGPQDLPFTVNWNVLLEKMRENLNTYWAGWTRQPKRILMLYSDWGIQWAVTGVLRQFYTFRENTITTKVRAARYALTCVPDRWHPLIQEAIRIRENKGKSQYRLRTARALDAVKFLRYVIHTCNSSYK